MIAAEPHLPGDLQDIGRALTWSPGLAAVSSAQFGLRMHRGKAQGLEQEKVTGLLLDVLVMLFWDDECEPLSSSRAYTDSSASVAVQRSSQYRTIDNHISETPAQAVPVGR